MITITCTNTFPLIPVCRPLYQTIGKTVSAMRQNLIYYNPQFFIFLKKYLHFLKSRFNFDRPFNQRTIFKKGFY